MSKEQQHPPAGAEKPPPPGPPPPQKKQGAEGQAAEGQVTPMAMPDHLKDALAARGEGHDNTCDRCGANYVEIGHTLAYRHDRDGNLLGVVTWCTPCMELMLVRPPGSRKKVSMHGIEDRKRISLYNTFLRASLHHAARQVAREAALEVGKNMLDFWEYKDLAFNQVDEAIAGILFKLQKAEEVAVEYEAALKGESCQN